MLNERSSEFQTLGASSQHGNLVQPRRLRSKSKLRELVSETRVDLKDLIMPIFVEEGADIRNEIQSMPGIFRLSPDEELDKEIMEISGLGLTSVLLFGLPTKKDQSGSEAFNPNGVVQQALRRIKNLKDDITVICDVCLCEYTNHGHCGLLGVDGVIDNEKTTSALAKIAVSQARAGADFVAPSAMMDDQVLEIRLALDSEGFKSVPIMAYSAKYASGFYGPFREAADSAPRFGDRRSYQMDPRNVREALREIELDIKQGADIIMVKPALAYLDVVRAARQKFLLPLATYNVSGEYSMVKAAAMKGWIEEDRIVFEMLHSMKRAGADLIITYFAKQYARSKVRIE